MSEATSAHLDVPQPAVSPGKQRAVALADVRRLERLFGDCEWPERRVLGQARKRARARAMDVLDEVEAPAEGRTGALLGAAGELFRALLVEQAGDSHCDEDSEGYAELAARVQECTGLPALTLAAEVLRAPELLAVPPEIAVEVALSTLVSFAPLRSVSLWTLSGTEQPVCACHVGEGGASRGARQLGARILTDASPDSAAGERRLLVGVPVGRGDRPLAALVGLARPWMHAKCEPFFADAQPLLAAVLERDSLLSGNAASERALVESSERRLARLGFDLHDGPIQDVAVLAEDVRLLGQQLKPLVAAEMKRKLVQGRVEDIDSQLVALEGELRHIAHEVQGASVLLNRPFDRALRDHCEAFAARTGVEPKLTIEGDLALVSTSQQIALLNIVHEALNNVREHAGASEVRVGVWVRAKRIDAQVADDGSGFDLETTVMQAARKGRVGLLAINERARLLGGRCRIESRPGGPTVVSISFDHWLPLAAAAEGGRASASG